MKSRYISNVLSLLMAVLLLLSVFPAAAGAALYKEVPSDYMSGDNFGYSVSIDGNYAVVGAKNAGSTDIGAAYVYQLASGAWSEQIRLDPYDGQSGDKFGSAVSVSGNYIIVGAPEADVTASNTGSVYIFGREGAEWLDLAKISASDATASDNFGTSVAISDSFAVAGVPYDDDNGDDSGSVLIYKKPASGWGVWASLNSSERLALRTKLRGTGSVGGDLFGSSVAISGDRLIIGMPGDDYSVSGTFYTNVGSVYIYHYDGSVWTEETHFNIQSATDANSNISTFNFGRSVSIYGDYAIMGGKGKAFVSHYDGSAWSALTPLNADNRTAINYGVSVSITNAYAIVGADADNSGKGAAYVYKLNGSAWEEQTALKQVQPADDNEVIGDLFGFSVGISGELTVVGDPGMDIHDSVTDTWISDTGGAYFSFAVDESGFNYPPSIDGIGDVITNSFGTVNVPITVYDDGATLTVSATAEAITGGALPTVTPSPASLTLTGGTAAGAIQITPQTDVYGRFEITVTVSDGTKSASETFIFGVSHAPAIDDITDKEMAEDASPLSFSFKVYDQDGDALTVSAVSDNQDVLPDANILINGYASPYTTTLLADGTTFSRTLTLKLDPPLNANGTANVTVTVTDGSGDISDSFVLTVTGVNDPPLLSDIPNKSVSEDGTLGPFSLTVTDVDGDIALLSITATSGNITLIPDDTDHIIVDQSGAAPTLKIIPAPDEHGTAIITVTVDDGNGGTAIDTFTVTVNSVTDVPVLLNVPTVEQTINEGAGSLTINPDPPIIVRHGDFDGDTPTVSITAASSNQALVKNSSITINGTATTYSPDLVDKEAELVLTITPEDNITGSATITLTATDSNGAVVTKTFTFTVLDVNDPPTITTIEDQTTTEDTQKKNIAFTVSDVETPAELLTVTLTSSNQVLVPNGNIVMVGTGNNRTLNITPALNQYGTTEITVTVSDKYTPESEILTVTETFILTVTSVNDSPAITMNSTSPVTTLEDTQTGDIFFTISDVDIEDQLTVSVSAVNTTIVPIDDTHVNIENSGKTYVTQLGGGSQGIGLRITPGTNATGSTSVTVTVTDGKSPKTAVFMLTVTPVNDAPTLTGITEGQLFQTNEETAITIPIVLADVDTALSSLTVGTTSNSPEIVPNTNIKKLGSGANYTFTITPALDQIGTASLTVTVNDGTASTPYNFFLEVKPVNDAPVFSGITPYSTHYTNEDTIKEISFSLSDVDTDPGSITVTALSGNVNLVPNEYNNIHVEGTGSDRKVVIRPKENANTPEKGIAQITLTANDNSGSTTATQTLIFSFSVNEVNDPPVVTGVTDGQVITVDEEVAKTVTLTLSDVDSSIGDITLSAISSDTTVVANDKITFSGTGTSRTMTITSANDASGSAIITLTANDQETQYNTTVITFTVSISSVNDAPVISGITAYDVYYTDEDTQKEISFLLSDVDTAIGNVTVTALSSNVNLVPNDYNSIHVEGLGENRKVVIRPKENANTAEKGVAQITLTANDNSGSTTATHTLIFNLSVTAVNDAPVVTGVSEGQIIELEEEVAKTITLTLSDVDSTVGNIMLSAESLNTAVVANSKITFSGTGTTRTMSITSSMDQIGYANIVLTADDMSGTETAETIIVFTVEVDSVNDAPFVFSGLVKNQVIVINEDTSLDIPIVLADVDTAVENITVKVTSANVNLIPNLYANLRITGTGADRNIYILPKENANTYDNQTAAITLELNDNTGTATAVSTLVFTVDVTQINDPPKITNIDPAVIISTPEETQKQIAITLTDADTPLGDIELSAESDNQDIVPNANIWFTGTLGSRVMYIQPADNQTGTLSIAITADDHEAENNILVLTITLAVGAINDPPSILGIDPFDVKTFFEDLEDLEPDETQAYEIPFRVEDVEQDPHQLTVSVKSGNTKLVADAYASLHVEVIESDDPLNDPLQGKCIIDPADCQDPLDCICNRKLVIVPEPDANTYDFGTGTITMTVNDNTDTDTATSDFTFTIEVNPVNDPPEISGISEGMIIDAEEDVAASIPVTLSDKESAATLIGLTPESGNETLVQNTDIQITGTGASRTIVITPQTDQSGDVPITVTANDNSGESNSTATVTFILRLNAVNDSPSVDTETSEIKPNAVVSINEDDNTTLSIIVTDLDTPVQAITIEAVSANTNLIPNEYMNLHVEPGSTDDERIIVINPKENANTPNNGTAKITLTIDDNTGTTTAKNTMTFTVNVLPVNDHPGITGISKDQIFPAQEDIELDIPFTLTDIDSLVENITVTITSSDETILPTDYAHAHITGGGASRVLTVKPAANQSGMVSVTLTADDGAAVDHSYSLTFKLAVEIANDPPVISGIIPNQVVTMNEDTTENIVFRVDDVDTALSNVTVSAVSSNIKLVPNDFAYLKISKVEILTDPVTTEEYKEVTLTVTPLAHMNSALVGNTEITITATDNTGTPTAVNTLTFILLVNSGNDAPSITATTTNWTMNEDETKEFSFTISDPDKDELSLTILSSNAGVLPVDGVHIKVNGTDYSDGFKIRQDVYSAGAIKLTVTPAENANTGANPSTPITVSVAVEDIDGDSDTKNFFLTVMPVSDPPTIFITPGPKVTPVNTPITVTFRVDDVDTPIGQLAVNAISLNTALVPLSNITGPTYITPAGPNDPNYTMSINPALDQTGTADIEIQVYDGLDPDPTTATFTMTVYEVASPSIPQIFIESPVYTSEDVPVTVIFTIVDEDTGVNEFKTIDVHPVIVTDPLIPYENIVQPTPTASQPADPREHTYQMTINPGTNVFGTVELEILVIDEKNQPAPVQVTKKFTVIIHPINDRPVILDLPSLITGVENRTEELDFLIYDPDGGNLTLTTLSYNTDLVPNVNIKVTESDDTVATFPVALDMDERYPLKLIITPKTNAFGTATIEVKLRDDSGSVFDTFTQNITYTIGEVKPGDLNVDTFVDLRDAILALQIAAGIPVTNVNRGADVNNDTKLSHVEAVFVLQKVAGLR
ncbi:MAG: tandem-95 repeat protein [Desulfococcaceae bacterium]